ncbi:MAG: hypothetical protein BWY70_01613 [Bacteroidetes bacterium ADurb.Bin408]|nr:MAG: hypothetical protein BWY70_01613 [Bacteroidetes bacterium ADurb.Bin408]
MRVIKTLKGLATSIKIKLNRIPEPVTNNNSEGKSNKPNVRNIEICPSQAKPSKKPVNAFLCINC